LQTNKEQCRDRLRCACRAMTEVHPASLSPSGEGDPVEGGERGGVGSLRIGRERRVRGVVDRVATDRAAQDVFCRCSHNFER
jgi:hypothetical protein